jgi:hypothetical protein
MKQRLTHIAVVCIVAAASAIYAGVNFLAGFPWSEKIFGGH